MTSYVFEENKHGIEHVFKKQEIIKNRQTYQNKFITRLFRMKKNKISKFKRTLGKKASNQSQIKIKLKSR